jgi:hypothetical protein
MFSSFSFHFSIIFCGRAHGEVYSCNGLEEKYWKESMGNIREARSFEDIWQGPQAQRVRAKVRTCPKNCWMVGTASPVMHKYIRKIAPWIIRNKIKSLLRRPIDSVAPDMNVGQDPRQGNLGKALK